MTIHQLNQINIYALSFRIYAALLCENDMSLNRIAAKTGVTWKTVKRKINTLESKGLVIKTNNRSKTDTYSGIDRTMENNLSTMEKDISSVVENNTTTVENGIGAMENDPETMEIYEKYS